MSLSRPSMGRLSQAHFNPDAQRKQAPLASVRMRRSTANERRAAVRGSGYFRSAASQTVRGAARAALRAFGVGSGVEWSDLAPSDLPAAGRPNICAVCTLEVDESALSACMRWEDTGRSDGRSSRDARFVMLHRSRVHLQFCRACAVMMHSSVAKPTQRPHSS